MPMPRYRRVKYVALTTQQKPQKTAMKILNELAALEHRPVQASLLNLIEQEGWYKLKQLKVKPK